MTITTNLNGKRGIELLQDLVVPFVKDREK
jgi:hypothetical protein